MKPQTVERELRQIAGRFRRRELWRHLTAVWSLALLAAWGGFFLSHSEGRPWSIEPLAMGAAALAVLVVLRALLRRRDLHAVARQIEHEYPELDTKLLAAYEQERCAVAGERSFLQDAVIQQARVHALNHQHWTRTVPRGELLAWGSVQWLALLLLSGSLFVQSHATFIPSTETGTPAAAVETPIEPKLAVHVEPGDVELERGTDLLVLARFAEHDRLPRAVTVVASDTQGERSYPMQQSLSDPVFAVRVSEVKQDLTYRLTLDAQQTQAYRVTVFDYPELDRADAELRYPSYTGQNERRLEDVRQFSAVEGTELRLLCRLNKSVASAKLVSSEGEPIALEPTTNDPTLYSLTRVLTQSVRWKLELLDDRQRKNRQGVEFVVNVVPNRAPTLKLVFPRQDVKASPLQELSLEAEVSDDFGVVRWGIAYEMTGRNGVSVTLGEQLKPGDRHTGKQLVALEDMQAKPDELLAWHAWAEDMGPDGQARRTTSDIFFAEVSPFEEIFREQSSDGGAAPAGKGQANAAEELAKLQKEIISATWNLRRRESGAAVSQGYAADARVIAESQQKAIEKLAEAKQKLQSPDASATVDEIAKHMQRAEQALSAAAKEGVLPPLDSALVAEQAAYQGLLKLRARETRVSRSKSAAGGGGGQQSASGQALDQLELNNEEQRYEKRNSAASAEQTPAQKEREEFLARLRELARRQEDMNQKIKELQAALDAARNEDEKKQIERQLKRLRDEQREMLRDVDQLKSKVDQPQHSPPQADASKQLESTRENIRKASDALDKGQTAQALSAGKRAESELDKLREDFRQKSAHEFGDEVRDLVDRARQLDERQQKIGQQLAGNAPEAKRPEKAGLRSSSEPAKTKLPEELAEQRRELAEVLDKAKELTERAEGNEPVLSKQLYDTIRRTHQQQTERAVEIMHRLVDNGLPREAAKVEQQAREGVQQLRAGIEKAAEGVLGNDVESLRRAKREVDRLAQALDRELASAQGRPPGEPKSNDAAQATPASGQGDKPNENAKPGETPSPGQAPSKQGGAPKAGDQPQGKAAGQGKASAQSKEPSQGQGQQPGQGQSKEPSAGQAQAKGSPSGQAQGQPSGQGQPKGEGRQPGQGQSGQSPGKSGAGQQPGQGQQPAPSQQPSSGQVAGQNRSGGERMSGTQVGPGGGEHGVLNGPDWRAWSDALRNVEEFVPGTRLRGEAARIREQAQALRAESKRHSKTPNWDLVRETVYEPLVELQRQLNEELLRRNSTEAAVPLDRDPVPDRFGEAVRRYYERLGSGQ